MAKGGAVFVLLAHVICQGLVYGLEWEMLPEEYIYACAGSSVQFPWKFNVTEKDTIVGINWIRDGALSSTIVGTMVGQLFIATDDFAGRVGRLQESNGGLLVEDANMDDSGNYTLEVQVTRGPVLETLKSSVILQVSEGLMLKGGRLQAAQDPVAWFDEATQLWFVRLTCGSFTFQGHPSVQVSWTTPDGRTVSSSGYESGHFYLSLTPPVQGGNYTCTIPPDSLPLLCYRNKGGLASQLGLSAHVTMDESRARLSLMEANQNAVHQDAKELERLMNSLEGNKRVDMHDTPLCQEMTKIIQDTMEHLQIAQRSFTGKVETLHNKTIVAALAGICHPGLYTEVDDEWRMSSNGKTGSIECDNDLTPGWYRFRLNGRNAVLPTECVPKNHCNTHAPQWLDLQGQSTPTVGREVTGRTCANWDENCCRWDAPVVVRNCGDFFLYKLTPRSNCNLVHCVELQN